MGFGVNTFGFNGLGNALTEVPTLQQVVEAGNTITIADDNIAIAVLGTDGFNKLNFGNSTDNAGFIQFFNNADAVTVSVDGQTGFVTANKYIITGGTSSQFLKADGSLDGNTYLTTTSAASTYQPILISGTNIKTINGNSVLGSGDLVIAPGISGSGAANQVAFWNGTSSQTGSGNFLWESSLNRLRIESGTLVVRQSNNVVALSSTINGGFLDTYTDTTLVTAAGIGINTLSQGKVAFGAFPINSSFANTNNKFLFGNSGFGGGCEFWASNNQEYIFNVAWNRLEHFIIRGNNLGVNNSSRLFFQNPNSIGSFVSYANLSGGVESNTAGSHNGFFTINTATSGTVTEKFRLTSAGNVILQNSGTFTDDGGRLKVVGSSSTTGFSLTIQNSTPTNILQVLNAGRILVGNATDNATAVLNLNGGTTLGFLTCRMTTGNFNSISSKAQGLEVFSTDDAGVLWFDGTRTIGYRYNGANFQGYDGTNWINLN